MVLLSLQFAQAQYCTSVADTNYSHEITQVTIRNASTGAVMLENNTNCFSLSGSYGTASGTANQYSDFTTLTSIPRPKLTMGKYHSLTVKVKNCASSTYGGIMIAYIDYNHDFDFLDSNETIYINTAYSTDTMKTVDFSVPNGSYAGITRMRVVYRLSTSITSMNPCGLVNMAGETEDYEVELINCSGYQASVGVAGTAGVTVLTAILNPNDSNVVSYQWTKNQSIISGATSKNYSFNTGSDSGYFCCKIVKTNGCIYEACTTINKSNNNPVPSCAQYRNFNYTKNGTSFVFNPIYTVPSPYVATYYWQFSNGTTSSVKNPSVTFTSSNNWAKLKICILDSLQNLVCCDSSRKDSIKGCSMYCYITKVGDSLYVSVSGGTGGKSYYWGNGIFGEKIKAVNPGIYNVYVSDSFGCYTQCSYTINMPCNIKANFYKSVGTNGNIAFIDSTTPLNGTYSYYWNFGDSSTSSAKNPVHEFKVNGTYTVRLKVCKYINSNNQVCCDTISKTVTVTNANPCNRFVPNFTWTTSGASYTFSNTSNMTNFNFVSVVYHVSTGANYTTASPSHVFTKNGTYSVTMTMTVFDVLTGLNCTKSITKYFYVNTSICGCLKANNTFSKIGFSMIYTNTSTCTDSSTKYLYKHGNGATDTIPNPTYTYPLPGLYRTVMYVTKTVGSYTCTDSIVRIVQITSTNPCKDSGYFTSYPYNCGDYVSPVCGCDTVTYKNYCFAAKEGVKQYTLGPCANDTMYVKICGYVYRDLNKNCAYDTIDQPLAQIPIRFNTTPIRYAYTNASGYYTIYLPKGTYTLTQILNNQYFPTNQLCPASNASLMVAATTGGVTYCNNNFYDTTNTCQDIATSIQRIANITPGFTSMKRIKYENRGATPVSGVTLNYRFLNGLTVKSTTTPTYTVSGNTISWNLGTLAPYSVGYKSANFTVPVTGIALGTAVVDTVWISPTTGDCNVANNYALYYDTCVGSWDPNDKSAYPANMIDTSVKTIEYLVRFQNTGNAPAHNVMIEDQIDDNFIKESLVIKGSSHTMNYFYQDNGKLYFEFPNINLPDSGSDYDASQGFVSYAVNLKDGLAVGTQMKNTAHIFFDFNEAVITNTTVNTIYLKSTTGVQQLGKDMNISIFPNPVQNKAVLKVNLDKVSRLSYTLYDFNGKMISQKDVSKAQIGEFTDEMNLENISKGIYILNVQINGEDNSFKLVKE